MPATSPCSTPWLCSHCEPSAAGDPPDVPPPPPRFPSHSKAPPLKADVRPLPAVCSAACRHGDTLVPLGGSTLWCLWVKAWWPCHSSHPGPTTRGPALVPAPTHPPGSQGSGQKGVSGCGPPPPCHHSTWPWGQSVGVTLLGVTRHQPHTSLPAWGRGGMMPLAPPGSPCRVWGGKWVLPAPSEQP